jgi:nitrite reductase/ring-hydroxylating ferredoxin subunit
MALDPLIAYRRAHRLRLYGALLSRNGDRHGIFAREASTRSERMAARIDLCATDEVAPGTALKVDTAELSVAVFNLEGEFYVIDDNCTHGPGLLSEGFIEGDVIECPFHNGQFNIKTGAVVSPPCMVPIKTYKTVVEGGRVLIETD